jgi:thiol-disulfide isomerase/thioredoxin
MKQLWYFSAPWCGPCKQFGPTMDRVSNQGIPVNKVNVDYEPDATTKFGINLDQQKYLTVIQQYFVNGKQMELIVNFSMDMEYHLKYGLKVN